MGWIGKRCEMNRKGLWERLEVGMEGFAGGGMWEELEQEIRRWEVMQFYFN